MPKYLPQALKKYLHVKPKVPEHQPHKHNIPNYGAKVQLTELADTSKPLGKEDIKRLQEIIGAILYYARGTDGTIMATLNELASAQSKGTESTRKAMLKFLSYCATHDDAKIR